MRNLLLVAVGGAAGSAARYLVSVALAGASTSFPWATLAINVAGSFALGVLVGLWPPGDAASARLLLGVGVCGGFTTFSTFSVEAVTLAARGAVGPALAYGVVSVGGGVAAAAAGVFVGHAVAGR